MRALTQRFAVDTSILPSAAMGHLLREYKALQRRLCLSELLPMSSRTFQLAHQIAWLACRDEIDKLAAKGKFTTDEADVLARQALADDFAAAVMMPYDRFLESARASRHDLKILQHRFGASFEQVCHRLTTLRCQQQYFVNGTGNIGGPAAAGATTATFSATTAATIASNQSATW